MSYIENLTLEELAFLSTKKNGFKSKKKAEKLLRKKSEKEAFIRYKDEVAIKENRRQILNDLPF